MVRMAIFISLRPAAFYFSHNNHTANGLISQLASNAWWHVQKVDLR
jgi:hypothetical protein